MWKAVCKVIALAGLLSATASFTQSINSGDIRGTVTDSSGAVIKGVSVTVTNVATQVSKTVVTDNAGVYDTSSIVTGPYTVTFSMSGFDQLVRGPVTIEAGYTTVNAVLQVGAVTQKVVVTSDIPLLKTESGDLTTTLQSNVMEELPQVTEDWENFMIMLPGTTGTATSSYGASNPGQEISSNGNLPYNKVLEDGADATLALSGYSNVSTFEDVAELQVSQSSFSAQYGNGGTIMNQITKGGTDHWHGDAYEYFQNSALNAANFGFGYKVAVPYLRYNDFGASIGGPIALPHLRKRAFFYFNYDKYLDNSVVTGFSTVPTAATLSGNFTGGYTLYDPTTQTIGTDSAGNPYPIRKSFLQEYGTNAIPASLWDTVSKNLQAYYPTAANSVGYFVPGTINGQGVDENNWYYEYPLDYHAARYFGRLDYDITPSNRLTATDYEIDSPYTTYSAVFACPIGCDETVFRNNNAQLTDVWSISSRTINEARIGFSYSLGQYVDSTLNRGFPAALGWTFAKADDLPSVGGTPYAGFGPGVNTVTDQDAYEPADVVTLIRGKNILHFGGAFPFYQINETAWGNINSGTLEFYGSYTQDWTLNSSGIASPNTSGSGNGYADFLLGYAGSWGASYTPEYSPRLKNPQMFVQDDIKVHPNLTLNLGLRYEISHGFNVLNGNEDVFDPTIENSATNTLGAYWFGSTHTNGRKSLEANVFSTFLPRLGFSWLVRPDTTIRGGVGLFAYDFSQDQYGNGMGAAVSSSGSYGDQSDGIYPVTKFDGNGTLFPLGCTTSCSGYTPGAALPYTSASTSPTRFNGQGAIYQPYHTPIPKIWQWNFGVEHQLARNYVATLSYVASHGFNLAFPTDINAVLTNRSSNDSAYRPYPEYEGISGPLPQGISNYNSLQATITKRMTNGFSLSFNYVWSHMLDDADTSAIGGSGAGTQTIQQESTLTVNNAALNYAASNFDERNVFKGYAIYQLPFGEGQRWLNHGGLVDEVVGGWHVSGVIVLASGNPFQLYADGNTYELDGSQYPNKVSGVNPYQGGHNWHEWFNPEAFSAPGNGNYGDAGRNTLVGPGLNYVNLSGGKTFSLEKSLKFQIRCDATNAFNHPQFAGPTGGLENPNSNGIYTTTYGGSQQISGLKMGGRQVQLVGRLSF